jgi:glycosyltransferase involved in cell wall biosynthesis
VRICVVYDCLYPYTVGGAERWYRALAERLAAAGHEVSYLTMHQWPRGTDPDLPGVKVIAVGPGMALYTGPRRRIVPPLVFGAGVFAHLLRRGSRYDVVHTASFPYFSLLAAGLARRRGSFRVFVDWHEVWTRGYWHDYVGRLGGEIGWRIQRLCMRIPQRAFCFSRLHEQRLREEGFGGPTSVLEGEYAGSTVDGEPAPADDVVVFAGRHIPEKRAPAVVDAVAKARERLPQLRAQVFGSGPDHQEVLARIAELRLADTVDAPGFVPGEEVESALARALCLLLPSRREGYGLVVVEAAARGTPSVVVRGPDNAATELVANGENGYVAESADADVLADAIVRVHTEGQSLRERTLAWFHANATRLSLANSLETVLASYER